jgi:hypothetical protein
MNDLGRAMLLRAADPRSGPVKPVKPGQNNFFCGVKKCFGQGYHPSLGQKNF